MTSLERRSVFAIFRNPLRGQSDDEAVVPPGATDASGVSNGELAAIFQRYGVLVLRWANRIFRDGATADDVLHEVMLRLLKRGSTFVALESEAQRRQWLYCTTLRLCLDIKAKHKRERGRAEEATSFRAQERSVPFEERDLLDGLFQRLDVEERILAVLYYEEGFTKSEIHALVARSRPFIDKKLDRIAGELQLIREL